MHFDWYQATLQALPSDVINGLGSDLGAVDLERSSGRHGYAVATTLRGDQGQRLAVILSGNSDGRPNVTGSGLHAQAVASSIRARWPLHQVTRCDAAEDFVGLGAFDRLEAVCRSVAGGHRVKGRSIVPDDPSDGRTYYLGSKTSDAQARLYDKTAEMRSRMPQERHHEIPEGLTRLEVQMRPRKARRAQLAQLDPAQVWGSVKWTWELANRALALGIERLPQLPVEVTDDARAMQFMLAQYAPTMARMAARLGTSAVLDTIAQAITEAQARADRRRERG